jgi:hypothetical protein
MGAQTYKVDSIIQLQAQIIHLVFEGFFGIYLTIASGNGLDS